MRSTLISDGPQKTYAVTFEAGDDPESGLALIVPEDTDSGTKAGEEVP